MDLDDVKFFQEFEETADGVPEGETADRVQIPVHPEFEQDEIGF